MSSSSSSSAAAPKSVKVKAIDATPSTFAEFGQVISASADGDAFGPDDAELDLHRGIPRFYIMNLVNQRPKFGRITHHASVTQCLSAVGGGEWYLGVAKKSIVGESEIDGGMNAVKAAAGHYYLPPNPDDVRVFRVEGAKFLKLNVGTWHAGPLFKTKAMHFYNLELSNTNMSSSSSSSAAAPKSVKVKAIDATPLTFAEFGQVISASAGGDAFGLDDAQLDLHRGIPRWWITLFMIFSRRRALCS